MVLVKEDVSMLSVMEQYCIKEHYYYCINILWYFLLFLENVSTLNVGSQHKMLHNGKLLGGKCPNNDAYCRFSVGTITILMQREHDEMGQRIILSLTTSYFYSLI